jgi:hypothetical protein
VNRRRLVAVALAILVLLGGVGIVAAATEELDFPGHVHQCHTNNADWCRGPDGSNAEHWRHDEDGHRHWLIFG